MATDRDAERLYRRMLNACRTDNDREQLENLVERQGLYVVDSLSPCENGEECTGEYRPGEGIFLSLALDRYPDAAVLSTYLHESVHAGAFTDGRELCRHNGYFSAINRRAQHQFGLHYVPQQARYDIQESIERLREKQAGDDRRFWLGLAMVGGAWFVLYQIFVVNW